MRRVVVILAVAVLAMSVAASADIISTNKFGSINFTSSGIVSTGMQVYSFSGYATPAFGPLGHMSFGTGACLSGCNGSGIPLASGVGSISTFSSLGSWFNITCANHASCGTLGSSLFKGAFTGTVTLTEIAKVGQNLEFELTGNIKGMLANGMTVSGTTDQVFFTATQQLGRGIAHIKGGTTNLVVPEPGTLGLLGTGLVGIAGMLRRKMLRS